MRAALLLLAALLLTACVSRPPQQSLPLQPYAQRRLALQSIERYSVEARVAVAVGSEGFNVNLIWNQTGPRSELDLRAPLGFGAAHVLSEGQGLQVDAGQGQHYAGRSAHDELTRRLGFEPPLHSLRYWLLGVPDPSAEVLETLSEDGLRLQAMEQGGWQIQIQELARYGDGALQAGLPRRLSLQREGVRVKLVIDQWTLSAP